MHHNKSSTLRAALVDAVPGVALLRQALVPGHVDRVADTQVDHDSYGKFFEEIC